MPRACSGIYTSLKRPYLFAFFPSPAIYRWAREAGDFSQPGSPGFRSGFSRMVCLAKAIGEGR